MKSVFLSLLLISVLKFTEAQTVKDPNFFPICVWLQNTSNAKEYKDIGVNLYVGLYKPLDSVQLLNLKAAGIKLMCSQNDFGLRHKTDTTIFGWTQEDEPDNAQWNDVTKQYDPCISPSEIIQNYNSVKQKDRDRLSTLI